MCCVQTESLSGYADWVCRTISDKSKLSMPWYQYAISQMGAVSSAVDAATKYLGWYHHLIIIILFTAPAICESSR